jgi:hypothetical protein
MFNVQRVRRRLIVIGPNPKCPVRVARLLPPPDLSLPEL